MSRKRCISVTYDTSTTEEEEMSDVSPRRCYRGTASRKQKEPATMDENIVVEPRRRVRGPSKRPCLNRNALMARENRQRKKEYLQKIENKLSFYQEENKNLANIIQKQGIDIKRLTGEVAYLKSVLHNSTAITALLKSINSGLWKRCSCFMNDVKLKNVDQFKLKTENPVPFGYNEGSMKCDNPGVPIARKTAYPFSATDHTYTTSKHVSSLNMENQQDGKEAKRLNGLNGLNGFTLNDMHFYNSVSTEHAAPKSIGNTKSMKNNTKILDTRGIINNVDVLGNLYDGESLSTNVQKTAMDKDVVDSPSTRNKGVVLDIMDNETLLNQKNTIDNRPGTDVDNLVPITQSSLNSDTAQDSIMAQTNPDQMPLFNMDIFEDIPKCDDFANALDELEEDPGLFSEGQLLPNLSNAGICLHVNSDKVSLEFCSVCHLNSTNSEFD